MVQDSLLRCLETDTELAFIRTFSKKLRQSLASYRDWKSELAFVTACVPSLSLSGKVYPSSMPAIPACLCACLPVPSSLHPGCIGSESAGTWSEVSQERFRWVGTGNRPGR